MKGLRGLGRVYVYIEEGRQLADCWVCGRFGKERLDGTGTSWCPRCGTVEVVRARRRRAPLSEAHEGTSRGNSARPHHGPHEAAALKAGG